MARRIRFLSWITRWASQIFTIKTTTMQMSCRITNNSSHLLDKESRSKHCRISCCRRMMMKRRSHCQWTASSTRRIRRRTQRVRAPTKTSFISCCTHRAIIKTSFSKRWSKIQSVTSKHSTLRFLMATLAVSRFSKTSWQMMCRPRAWAWPRRLTSTDE